VDFSQKQELAGSKEFLQELSLQEICGVSQVFLQGFYRVGQDVLQHVGQDRPFDKADFFLAKGCCFYRGQTLFEVCCWKRRTFHKSRRLVAKTGWWLGLRLCGSDRGKGVMGG
jgi:hypothetical protein